MPDEPIEQPVTAATEPIEPEPTPAAPVEPVEPVHPLEPGGARFSEVYRDMQEARREAARLQGELDATRRQQATQQPQQQAFYTPQQLQGLVDNGQITPAVMTAQIAWQERQIAKQEMRQEWGQHERTRAAGADIQKYMAAIPKLTDPSSEEFRRVDRINREIADEMGLPVEDPRSQRRALQIAFGPLDKITKTQVQAEASRVQADTYVETGAGGRVAAVKPAADPLKDVPAMYKQHWARLGYTQAQMIEEAKYIRPTPRVRAGLLKP